MTSKSVEAINRRIVIMASHLQGWTNEGIAVGMGVSEAYVRRLILKDKKSTRIMGGAMMYIQAKEKEEAGFLAGSD